MTNFPAEPCSFQISEKSNDPITNTEISLKWNNQNGTELTEKTGFLALLNLSGGSLNIHDLNKLQSMLMIEKHP